MRSTILAILATATLVTGCVGGADDLNAASTSDLSSATTLPTAEPFTWDGTYTPGASVCPVVTCLTARVAGTYMDLEPQGDITALSLTLTWDAVSPTMSELRFGITWDEDQLEYVEGSSPLLLELDGLNISRSESPYVWTWPVTPAPQGAATVLTPQDFRAEGTITELRAAEPTADADATTPESVLAVAEQGSFGVGATACVPVTCVGQTVVGGDRIFPQADAQGIVDVALVAEWVSENPATEQMALGVFACPKDCASDAEISSFEFAYGASPLALDVSGFKVPEGEVLYVYMQQGGTTLPVLYALATLPQDFMIAGTLTLPVTATAEAGEAASSVGA